MEHAQGGRNFQVLARLKPGVTVEQADAEMKALARQLEQEYRQANANWSAKAVQLTSEIYGKVQTPLFVLMGAVALILLIACTNVASLLLARQMLIESSTLATLGGALGVAIAYALIEALKLFGPPDVRRLNDAGLNGGVLLFTAAMTASTGLALGLAPALLAARRSLGASLHEGGRGSSAGKRTNLLRDAFTVAQVALALTLLVGAGLLMRSFARLIAVEPGFRTDHVLTINVNLPGARYRDGKDVEFFAELGRRARALPGVINASTITFLPFKGGGSATYFWRAEKPRPAPGQEPVTDVRMVQPQYFETMNIPLRRGRTFDDRDNDAKAPLRFVINDAMAQQMYPGEDPIGKALVVQMKRENLPGEIIGIVGNVKHGSLSDQTRAMVYYPQAHLSFGFGTLVVHTSVEPLSLARAVTSAVQSMDPELPVSEVGTMQRWMDQSLSRAKFQTVLLGAFAGLALVLAMLGIFGVMSYVVTQRTHEIGVRMALGAQRGQVARMVLSRALLLTVAGLTLGVAAIAAALVPTARATKVDPMVVLRYE